MGRSMAAFGTILLVCGILHIITCQTTLKERLFSKKTGLLQLSPHSGPEMTSCLGRRCTALSCAQACQEEDGCVVFSHNEADAKCILSRRPMYFPANHSEWNTYYTGKLRNTHRIERQNAFKQDTGEGDAFAQATNKQAVISHEKRDERKNVFSACVACVTGKRRARCTYKLQYWG